jgi:phosphoribosylaminoimidazolecarboxamide formyltransferase / IMP cyclohydrolase
MNRVSETVDYTSIKNVIVSVYDKTNLDVLIPALINLCPDVTFYSTGGTFRALERILGDESRVRLVSISDYTGQPEMQGGLVKTLDFKIYLGLLNEPFNNEHDNYLQKAKGVSFDMVIVNLYPFNQVTAKSDVSLEEARSNIDIGGPCMLRAAAKNFIRVISLCDPTDYPVLLETLRKSSGRINIEQRFEFAKKAFSHTAAYDDSIMKFLFSIDPTVVKNEYTFRQEE